MRLMINGEERAFHLTLTPGQMPPEVARHGVTALDVEVRIGESLMQTRFQHSILRESALTETARAALTEAMQRTVNRAVNRVLAVALQQRLSTRLTEHLAPRHRQTVRNEVSAEGTFRTYATANIHF